MSSYSTSADSYESDEPPRLQLDLERLMGRAADVLNADCINAQQLTRGSNHEIFVLQFRLRPKGPAVLESLKKAGLSCIARFTRVKDHEARESSEVATLRYLRRQTSIPVPEVYYEDLDPDNDVGASFVLMEKMPGRHLYKIWDDMSLEQKKSALSQVAGVVVQLASLRFDRIGCLSEDGVGPLVSPCFEDPVGPFESTLQYLQAFVATNSAIAGAELGSEIETVALNEPEIETETATKLESYHRQKVQEELKRFFALHTDTTYLNPPFCMIHADFDAQNMLFCHNNEERRVITWAVPGCGRLDSCSLTAH